MSDRTIPLLVPIATELSWLTSKKPLLRIMVTRLNNAVPLSSRELSTAGSDVEGTAINSITVFLDIIPRPVSFYLKHRMLWRLCYVSDLMWNLLSWTKFSEIQ
jgi:hypothetical protein